MATPLTLPQTLAVIREHRLVLQAAGPKLRCGPSAALTDPLRDGLRSHKPLLVDALNTWGLLVGLHVLFLLYEAAPATPFPLDRARFVVDPARFLTRLYQDVQVGPDGPRARTGALQEDLQLLFGYHTGSTD